MRQYNSIMYYFQITVWKSSQNLVLQFAHLKLEREIKQKSINHWIEDLILQYLKTFWIFTKKLSRALPVFEIQRVLYKICGLSREKALTIAMFLKIMFETIKTLQCDCSEYTTAASVRVRPDTRIFIDMNNFLFDECCHCLRHGQQVSPHKRVTYRPHTNRHENVKSHTNLQMTLRRYLNICYQWDAHKCNT